MGTRAISSAAEYIRAIDPREMPRYSIAEAARYLGVPESTLRAWFAGTTWGSRPYLKTFRPILQPASQDLLSFYDVASAHVLMAFKSKGATTENIRAVVESLQKEYPDARYPLLGRDFLMFGKSVIIERLGELMNLSRFRQMGLKNVMQKFLSRLELDENKMPTRFSPLRSVTARGKGWIVIDPDLSYGRPVVRGTGIAAEVIAKRRESGESVSSLSEDYRLSRRAIQEAISYIENKAA